MFQSCKNYRNFEYHCNCLFSVILFFCGSEYKIFRLALNLIRFFPFSGQLSVVLMYFFFSQNPVTAGLGHRKKAPDIADGIIIIIKVEMGGGFFSGNPFHCLRPFPKQIKKLPEPIRCFTVEVQQLARSFITQIQTEKNPVTFSLL